MKAFAQIGTLGILVFAGTTLFGAPASRSIKFQWNGSGCAKSESSSPWDPMVVQVLATKDIGSEFFVKRGGGSSPKDGRKNCDLIVSSDEPLQIAIERVELKGSGAVAVDAPIDLKLESSSQGAPERKTVNLSLPTGKVDYKVTQDIEEKDQFWSACGRSLLVSTKLSLKGSASVETRINRVSFHLQAKSCKKS